MRCDLIFNSFFVKYEKYLDTRCYNVIYVQYCTKRTSRTKAVQFFFIVYDVYRQLVLSVTSARHTCNIVLCNQNLGFVCHIFLLKLFNDFHFQKGR